MTKSWGAVQKHEILRQHDDSTATTDDTDSSRQIPGFSNNCLLSRFHSSMLLLLKRLKVAAASLHQYSLTDVSLSQIRWPWLSNIFDDILQPVGPNKEAASCWENNSCLVLPPSAIRPGYSAQRHLDRTERNQAESDATSSDPQDCVYFLGLLQSKKSENVCKDIGEGLVKTKQNKKSSHPLPVIL